MLVKSYRGCRLEVQDDGGEGWTVNVTDRHGGHVAILRNCVTQGLSVLLEEARCQVDKAQGHAQRPFC
jgi:hypothetical protein